MEKLIHNIEELDTLTRDTKQRINKAVVAAAIRIRDMIRASFVNDAQSLYKHHKGNIAHLTSGIMIGKDQGGSIKIHAMGNKSDYGSYKTRFFVGGTRYRKQTQMKGKAITLTAIIRADTSEFTKSINEAKSVLHQYTEEARKASQKI